MKNPSFALVCDFDGTITTRDLGDQLALRYGEPEAFRQAEAALRAGGLTLRDILRNIFEIIDATPEEIAAAAVEIAEVRQGFVELVADCEREGIPFVLASGGLDLYIDPVLRQVLPPSHDAYVERRYNLGRPGEGGGRDVTFPIEGGCGDCGSCKAVVVEELRGRGLGQVVAIGDGISDHCLLTSADLTFARDGLLREATRRGIDALAWEDFHDVRRWLDRRLLSPAQG
jgi:2-hydroxy-3-keto-5-methylthiopentenyl-1-phosphate phosphatase